LKHGGGGKGSKKQQDGGKSFGKKIEKKERKTQIGGELGRPEGLLP